MSVTTARQRVLSYFGKQRSASAAQIGRALNMSAANVRHHLSILLSDGRIVVAGSARTGGRGRPVKIYRASDHILGNNLALLSDVLLSEWLGKLPRGKREDVLQGLAKALLNHMGQAGSQVPVAKRLAFVLEKLNEFHYQARWEAGAEGPRILFGCCPYARIIDKHPELCRMDVVLVGELMNSRADQLAKIEQGPGGPSSCVFRLG